MHVDLLQAPHNRHLAAVPPRAASVQMAVNLVSHYAKVPTVLIFHASRCRADTARARQLAMYLAHVILGESLTAIGIAFGRDRTTVSYACGLIEDLRDDPQFDAEVSELEVELQVNVETARG